MFGSSEVPALVEPRVPVGGWKINRYTQISSMIQIVVSAQDDTGLVGGGRPHLESVVRESLLG